MTLENILWKGSYLVLQDSYFFQIYLGDGNKFTSTDYYPRFEYQIQQEVPD